MTNVDQYPKREIQNTVLYALYALYDIINSIDRVVDAWTILLIFSISLSLMTHHAACLSACTQASHQIPPGRRLRDESGEIAPTMYTYMWQLVPVCIARLSLRHNMLPQSLLMRATSDRHAFVQVSSFGRLSQGSSPCSVQCALSGRHQCQS